MSQYWVCIRSVFEKIIGPYEVCIFVNIGPYEKMAALHEVHNSAGRHGASRHPRDEDEDGWIDEGNLDLAEELTENRQKAKCSQVH